MKMKFAPPNYTQIPNNLLDRYLPEISPAELKVTLAVARNTFGWHRERHMMSISYLTKAAGLSRQGVINGINAGLERGTLGRIQRGQSYEYFLEVIDEETDEVVNEIDQSANKVVNEVDQCQSTKLTTTSQRSRPKLVNEVDTTKKGKKVKEKRDDDDQRQPEVLEVLQAQAQAPTPPAVTLVFDAPASDWVVRLHESIFQTIGPIDADAIRGFPAKYPRAWIKEAYRRAKVETAKPGKRIMAPGSYLSSILESMYTSGLTGQGTYNDQQTNHAGLAAFGQKPGNHSGGHHGTNGRPANQSALGRPIVFANDAERLEFEEQFKDWQF